MRFHRFRVLVDDHVKLLSNVRMFWKDNRKFYLDYPDFRTPPYSLAFDAYAHVSWRGYLKHGLQHAQLISDIIKEHTFNHTGRLGRVLDWGCGPGRVICHMPGMLGKTDWSVYGCDNNARSIRWCRKSLPEIEFACNELQPPMPYENNYFDVIYGISVFTHLSEGLHYRWRDELLRCLSPGGLLILTLNGERRAVDLANKEDRDRLHEGQFVSVQSASEGKKYYASFHHPAWVKEKFVPQMDILYHDVRDLFDWFTQDVWVLRKRD